MGASYLGLKSFVSVFKSKAHVLVDVSEPASDDSARLAKRSFFQGFMTNAIRSRRTERTVEVVTRLTLTGLGVRLAFEKP